MNLKIVEEWLNYLKDNWYKKNIEGATSLFKNTTFYQESPFCEPYTTFDEIKKEWQHIKN